MSTERTKKPINVNGHTLCWVDPLPCFFADGRRCTNGFLGGMPQWFAPKKPKQNTAWQKILIAADDYLTTKELIAKTALNGATVTMTIDKLCRGYYLDKFAVDGKNRYVYHRAKAGDKLLKSLTFTA